MGQDNFVNPVSRVGLEVDGHSTTLGATTDSESALGNGTVIALLKRHRTLLTTVTVLLGAGLPAGLIFGRLATDTVAATATAAAPTYVEGAAVKLSTDLSGVLRTTAGGGGPGGNPTGGFLDSVRLVRALDSIRTIRGIDSVRTLRSLDSIRTIKGVDSVRTLRALDSIRTIRGIDSVRTLRSLDSVRTVRALDSIRVVRFLDTVRTGITIGAPKGQQLAAASIPVVIASNQTTLPVSSAPPAGTIYTFSGLAMAKAASRNYATLFNADPVLVVEVVWIGVYAEATAAVVGLIRGYRVFRITSHSAGTLVTPISLDTNDPLIDPDITARVGNVTVGGAFSTAHGICAVREEETAGAELPACFDERTSAKPLVLRQNQGITVQQDATAGVGVLSVIVYFRVK